MAIIRRATESDIPRILELYVQLAFGGARGGKDRESIRTDYSRVFEEIDSFNGCELFVAEDEGKVVGTAMYVIVPNLSHTGLPWTIVENVVVDGECRRKGIGKLLMDYAAAKSKEAGCYKVQLLSHKTRTEAHRFYQSIGYKPSAEGFRLYL
jgi:GNAT superfamily N-acetyltransferase